MLKFPGDVSGTLFNVLDKYYITFGDRENLVLDGELTDQNFWFWVWPLDHLPFRYA